MKAYALGRRANGRIMSICIISPRNTATFRRLRGKRKIFGNEFNEKIFRVQLAYFKDIDYTESRVYMPGFEVSEATIKKELIRFSVV